MFEKVYLCLLRLFPAAFRKSYQEEALQLFRDRLRDEKGFLPRLRLGCDLVADLLQSLPQAHRNAYPESAPTPSLGTTLTFRTLEKEPMRREAIALAGFLSLAALLLFPYVLELSSNYQARFKTQPPSAIESVMQQLNPASSPFPEKTRPDFIDSPGPLSEAVPPSATPPATAEREQPAGFAEPALPTAMLTQPQRTSAAFLTVDILSDTQGIDFGPYMKEVISTVQTAWRPSLPQGQQSNPKETVIRCNIHQDGSVGAMVLAENSHQPILDQAAWNAITRAGNFPPLPAQFHGPGLTLNLHFAVRPNQ